MKRSQINAWIREGIWFFKTQRFALPPFAFWSFADWRRNYARASLIISSQLGWDVTDFRQADPERIGLLLFTLRNGGGRSSYAEKIMMVKRNQVTPMHFHWSKTEDIINRGGGRLVIETYQATPDESTSEAAVQLVVDGIVRELPAGARLELFPGESVTLAPRVYHRFWGEGERVLVGEVSSVNDDLQDNRFRRPIPRFPDVQEDEPPLHLLVTDYLRFLAPDQPSHEPAN